MTGGLTPRFADFKAFQTGNLYNNNRRASNKGGNEYYLTGIVNPHLILADLVKIFTPICCLSINWYTIGFYRNDRGI
ncbi:MAG: hypothetical protein HC880_12310 [Bacteroidia bacterium]|nr:hypothetical protein [Bacteroidia bacterium]